jgi:NAD(P)-dependent dehydrogenase (short-subunit alcohol dehydrogenase family)
MGAMTDLDGTTVVITGASSGIGAATARAPLSARRPSWVWVPAFRWPRRFVAVVASFPFSPVLDHRAPTAGIEPATPHLGNECSIR